MSGLDNFLSTRAGIGGFFDTSEDDWLNELLSNKRNWQELNPPETQYDTYNPKEFQYSLVDENPAVQNKQMALLERLAGLSDTGYSQADEASLMQGQEMAAQQARGQREALMQDAARRGMSGSGMQFAMAEQANQGAQQQAHSDMLQRLQDQAKMKALYNQAYGQQLGSVREQNLKPQMYNTDLINKFNQMNTQSQNEGQQYNIQNKYNAAQDAYKNKIARLSGLTGVGSQVGDFYKAQSAARQQGRDKDQESVMKMTSMFSGGM